MKIKSGLFMLGMLYGFIGQAFALSDENRPEYQKEYDAYLRDLEVIAQTGKAPVNPDLDADLAKMSSNDKILLTAPEVPYEEKVLAENDAKILNKVEVIHVPEEFREEYADIYREETGVLTTPSLVKETKPMDEKKAKVSEHQNPFQIKAKSQKESNTSEDSLVNAYFNPFGQPFVEGDTSSVKNTLQETSKSKTVSNDSSTREKSSSASSSTSSTMAQKPKTSSSSHSYSRKNSKLTSSPIGIKNSMFVR